MLPEKSEELLAVPMLDAASGTHSCFSNFESKWLHQGGLITGSVACILVGPGYSQSPAMRRNNCCSSVYTILQSIHKSANCPGRTCHTNLLDLFLSRRKQGSAGKPAKGKGNGQAGWNSGKGGADKWGARDEDDYDDDGKDEDDTEDDDYMDSDKEEAEPGAKAPPKKKRKPTDYGEWACDDQVGREFLSTCLSVSICRILGQGLGFVC